MLPQLTLALVVSQYRVLVQVHGTMMALLHKHPYTAVCSHALIVCPSAFTSRDVPSVAIPAYIQASKY